MNNYAYSLAERELRLEYALELARKAVDAQPDRGAYLDTIGWIYYKLGKYNLALTYISRSLENRENSAVVVEHLGDVYYKLGDLDEAARYWKQALEMDQDNRELRHKIENN
jgi:tetratricopeptide (TPR) repeat protein